MWQKPSNAGWMQRSDAERNVFMQMETTQGQGHPGREPNHPQTLGHRKVYLLGAMRRHQHQQRYRRELGLMVHDVYNERRDISGVWTANKAETH